jgi:two-component system chemotaxis response regulator CheY
MGRAADHGHAGEYILVVEDDEDVRGALAVFLQLEGYRVVEVSNGREALDYLRANSEPACVILLDMFMPVMDGWQFQAEKARSQFAGVPVIVISADASAARQSQDLGAVQNLVKPIDFDRLRDYVHEYC